jgi:hypothetical protein
VARLVTELGVGFRLDDDSRATVPHQLAADQFSGAGEGIALEKGAREFWHRLLFNRRGAEKRNRRLRRGTHIFSIGENL